MRILAFALWFSVFAAAPAFADAEEDAAIKPMQVFVNSINTGDAKTAVAECTANSVVMDEFPPFIWRGNGCAGFARDFFPMTKAHGVTDSHMQLLAASEMNIKDDSAYAVIPAHLTYKQKGAAAAEDGVFSVVLIKTAKGWKIAAFAWATAQGRVVPAN